MAASPDGRFAFVTLEDSQRAAVFNLGAALSRGFGPADYVGSIPLELAPVGITVSPDGRWLYATSEIAQRGTGAATLAPGGALSRHADRHRPAAGGNGPGRVGGRHRGRRL